jgi:acetyltransferase
MRFFSLVKTLSRDSLARLCRLDYGRDMALVAVARTARGEQIWGVARYYLDGPAGEAEFALVVGDGHQGLGLGRHLMQRLVAVARERGVRRLFGEVLRENGPMLALMRSLGFRPASVSEADVVRVELDLTGVVPQRE